MEKIEMKENNQQDYNPDLIQAMMGRMTENTGRMNGDCLPRVGWDGTGMANHDEICRNFQLLIDHGLVLGRIEDDVCRYHNLTYAGIHFFQNTLGWDVMEVTKKRAAGASFKDFIRILNETAIEAAKRCCDLGDKGPYWPVPFKPRNTAEVKENGFYDVKSLIAELQKYPEDALVRVSREHTTEPIHFIGYGTVKDDFNVLAMPAIVIM